MMRALIIIIEGKCGGLTSKGLKNYFGEYVNYEKLVSTCAYPCTVSECIVDQIVKEPCGGASRQRLVIGILSAFCLLCSLVFKSDPCVSRSALAPIP